MTTNIFAKINQVRSAVDYVRKDKRVGEGGYLAVTHDAVTKLTREHFISHGVIIVPDLVSSSTRETGTTTAKGVPFIRYEARYRFSVVNADSPDDRFSFDLESHAIDQADKAPGKALSYAKKYAVLKLLEIESGEDEEERETQKPRITPAAGAKNRVVPERRAHCEEIAGQVLDFLSAEMPEDAAMTFYDADLDTDEKVYVWTFFDSKQKSLLKKTWDAMKEKQNAKP